MKVQQIRVQVKLPKQSISENSGLFLSCLDSQVLLGPRGEKGRKRVENVEQVKHENKG